MKKKPSHSHTYIHKRHRLRSPSCDEKLLFALLSEQALFIFPKEYIYMYIYVYALYFCLTRFGISQKLILGIFLLFSLFFLPIPLCCIAPTTSISFSVYFGVCFIRFLRQFRLISAWVFFPFLISFLFL